MIINVYEVPSHDYGLLTVDVAVGFISSPVLNCQCFPICYLKFTQNYFLQEICLHTHSNSQIVFRSWTSKYPPFLLSKCFAYMVLKQFIPEIILIILGFEIYRQPNRATTMKYCTIKIPF